MNTWIMKDTIKSLLELPQGVGVAPKGAGENVSPQSTTPTPCLYSGVICLAKINGGFFIIARKAIDSENWVWQLSDSHLRFYIGIISFARWDKNPADFTAPDGTILKIERGQFACATRRLAEKMKLSREIIRTCLKKFTNNGFLTHKVTHGITVITIINYERYQDISLYLNPNNNPAITQAQPTDNPLINKDKETNKVNKEYIRDIFDFWLSFDTLPKHRKLTDGMKRAINARLNDGYTVENIKEAIELYATSKVKFWIKFRDDGCGWGLQDLLSRKGGQHIETRKKFKKSGYDPDKDITEEDWK